MIGADVFIKANILIQAHDLDAGAKYNKVSQLIRRFWDRRTISFPSVQVLQEIHVNLIRKGRSVNKSAEMVRRYLA